MKQLRRILTASNTCESNTRVHGWMKWAARETHRIELLMWAELAWSGCSQYSLQYIIRSNFSSPEGQRQNNPFLWSQGSKQKHKILSYTNLESYLILGNIKGAPYWGWRVSKGLWACLSDGDSWIENFCRAKARITLASRSAKFGQCKS